MLRYIGCKLPLALRVIIANSWFFRPLLRAIFLRKPATAAALRTTTAITVLRSGAKINAIPGEASAWVNHRIHPADSDAAAVLARDAAVVADERVTIEPVGTPTPVAPISPPSAWGFRTIQRTVQTMFPGAAVAPLLMIGNTDTRWYWGLSAHIYRFSAIELHLSELKMFHGVDERLSCAQLGRLRGFYELLLSEL